MNKTKTFVSFIGSRGSGKTTIASKLAENLESLGFCTLRQHRGLNEGMTLKGFYNAIVLWRYFDIEIMKKIGFCGRSRRLIPSLYRLYLPLAFNKDVLQLRNAKDVLIYDSNFLRGMMQAFYKDKIELNEFVGFFKRKILPRIDTFLLVVVDTDPEIAIERWLARDKVSLTLENLEMNIRDRIAQKCVVKTITSALIKVPNVKVLTINGSDPVDKNAKQILKELIGG